MAETFTCTWSPAVGPATVTRDGNTISFEFQARGDEGSILGALHREKRTYDAQHPRDAHVEFSLAGTSVGDRYEPIARDEQWSVAFNRCVNDMKLQSPKPPIDFLKAVRNLAHRY